MVGNVEQLLENTFVEDGYKEVVRGVRVGNDEEQRGFFIPDLVRGDGVRAKESAHCGHVQGCHAHTQRNDD